MERQTREEAQILIVFDDYSVTERLNTVLREAGLIAECANSITAGCEAASSGRFRVVVTTPVLSDGSWRRLVDAADHYGLGFEVVLFTSTFELSQWAEALAEGAFDVLDALHELPKAAAVTKRALEAADLKRARPRYEAGLAHLKWEAHR
ncbi:MAG TPA: hypothetical protein VHM88_27400 [Candidatus Acidoferrales bacterium]|nr:hypothetical protein [Candidatus Acidoferrales bacterium]